MKTIVLCNIGNSDIEVRPIDGEPFKPANPRVEGQALWEKYTESHFGLPIIEPCIEHVLNEVGSIDHVVLFDTDHQDEPSGYEEYKGVKNRDKDTLWYGRIVERFLTERFPSISKIERITVERINPSLYDDAFDVFKEKLAPINSLDYDTCYVFTSSGTPAFSNALLLRTISLFGAKSHAIYKPHSNAVYELLVGEQISASYSYMTVIELLTKNDFSGAYQILSSVPHVQADVLALTRYTRDRQAFDFEGAQAALKAARHTTGKIREFVRSINDDIAELLKHNQAALIKELYSNTVTMFSNGRYVDFVGRLFRLREAIYRYLVETIYAISTDYNKQHKEANQARFRDLLDKQPLLKEHLDSTKIDDKPLSYEDDLSSEVLLALVRYAVEGGLSAEGKPFVVTKNQASYKALYEKLNKFSSLNTLRNQSIIAHGFQGVSRTKIEQVYKGDILEDLGSIMSILRLKETYLTLDKVRDFLIEYIRKL